MRVFALMCFVALVIASSEGILTEKAPILRTNDYSLGGDGIGIVQGDFSAPMQGGSYGGPVQGDSAAPPQADGTAAPQADGAAPQQADGAASPQADGAAPPY